MKGGVNARTISAVALCSVVMACGPETPESKPPPPPPISSAPASSEAITRPVPPAPPPYVPAPVRFENPGGMWMPHQMAALQAKLKELGLTIDPKELTDPTSNTLSSIVSLGGCSASFVSPEGLVITNHHCAVAALQYNSKPDANLLKDGFLAKTKDDERSNGPTARVLVTQKVTDVTAKIFDPKIATRMTDRTRFKMIEKNEKDLVAECEKGRPGIRCGVSSFYDGAMYYLIEQLEIRDVRLVYAPASGVGNYGGEIDNWRWPRHSGDVSIFRAYVGKDGLPADYSKDNVPFKPAHYLKVAQKPLREGDLVMVAGYPGRTFSQRTRVQVEEYVNLIYPRSQKLCEDALATLETITDKDAKIRATPLVRRFGNQLTNIKGQLDGLTKDGVLQLKIDREAALQKWIDEDPARKAKYGTVLADMAKMYEDQKKTLESDLELRGEFLLPKLVNAAYTIVRIAEERGKADKDRHPDYQERNWSKIVQAQEALEQTYSRQVDLAMFNMALTRADKVDAKQRADVRGLIDKLGLVNRNATPYKPAVNILFEDTQLEKKEVRVELAKKATLADLKKSKDPMIRFALALRPLLKAGEDRDEAFDGRMAVLKPAYFEALRGFEGKEIAPDANSTLRITYGTVRGYSVKPDEPANRPFTMLSEVVKKNTGNEPFNAPQKLVDAFNQKKFGPYVDEQLGEVPVDFLSDLHITGGNSGSAVLDANGDITGLAFDSTYESLGSDWLFKPKITRCIGVDIRYVMWLLDGVDGGSNVLRELGRSPALATQ
jgi:hypothetical protein